MSLSDSDRYEPHDSWADPEPAEVREFNLAAPPNAAFDLAADYVRAVGIDATERRGDFYLDLSKNTEDRHWRLHYGTCAKLYHDAASDARHVEAIRERQRGAA